MKTPEDSVCINLLQCPLINTQRRCVFKMKIELSPFISCREQGCCYACSVKENDGCWIFKFSKDTQFEVFLKKQRYREWAHG